MCGLVGGNNPSWRYDAAIAALQHRGPDSRGRHVVNGLTLAFTRLAVVDLSDQADQPMTCCFDPRVRIVFNGEIYGYQKLRQQLVDDGMSFRTNSDSEVALNAYLKWGTDFVNHIDGMFAIVIHDDRSGNVFLFRDRAGIKPLYYYHDGHNFAFASELRAVTTLCDDVTFQTDESALYDFFTYGYVPCPKTQFRNIRQLPPAGYLKFDTTRRQISSQGYYWTLNVQPDSTIDVADAQDKVKDLLQTSVREQMVADVSVGCFLSGGIDSSIVAAEASSLRPSLQTFSVGFDDEAHSETPFATLAAECFQTTHHNVAYQPLAASAQLANLKHMYEDPFADTSAFPTSQVAAFARQSVTVALSGDGGDELFGGYRWYHRFARLLRFGATRLPGPAEWLEGIHSQQRSGSLRRKVAGAASMACADQLSLYARLLGTPPKAARRKWAAELGIHDDYDDWWSFRLYWRPDLPVRTRLQFLDFHTYLPDDILTKVDRASMRHSLEVRVPFLKRELIEFAFSLPESVRFADGQPKGILKHAYQQILPGDILRRSKKGFSIPPAHLTAFEGGIRESILTDRTGKRHDADRVSFRFNHSVSQGEQHPGDADVPGLRRRRA